jgi:lipopolysaccharide transport system permease protein
MAKVPSEGIPYPIFSYSGLLLWTYFSESLTASSNSLVGSANLINKIYFPRLLMPISSSLTGLLDYLIAMVILILMMAWYGFVPGPMLVFLPLVLLAGFLAATGVGLWLSAMNVRYRDVRYAIPFFVQIWLFATPVIYPSGMVPEKFRWILWLNPMSGIIEAHRACLLGHQTINWVSLGISFLIILMVFISGLYYFKWMEKSFADVI